MLNQICDWLAATAVSQALQSTSWAVPLIQTIHILGIAIILTSMAMLSVRLLGLAGTRQSMQQAAERLMPWMWRALGVMFATGALLILAEPARSLPNQLFQVKMLLLVAVLALSVYLERSRRTAGAAMGLPADLPYSRPLGALMLLAWTGIVVAGRWIAYI